MKLNHMLKKFKEYTNSASYHFPESIKLNSLKQNKSFDTNPLICSKESFDPNLRHNYKYRLKIHSTINLNENEYKMYDQFRNSELPNLIPIVNKSLRSITKSSVQLLDPYNIKKTNHNYNASKPHSISPYTEIKPHQLSTSQFEGSSENFSFYNGRNIDPQFSHKLKNVNFNNPINTSPKNNKNDLNKLNNLNNSQNIKNIKTIKNIKDMNDINDTDDKIEVKEKIIKYEKNPNMKSTLLNPTILESPKKKYYGNSQMQNEFSSQNQKASFNSENSENFTSSKILSNEDYFGNKFVSQTFNDSIFQNKNYYQDPNINLNQKSQELKINENNSSKSNYQFLSNPRFSTNSKQINEKSLSHNYSSFQKANKLNSEQVLLSSKKLAFLKESILSKTELKFKDEDKSDESDKEHHCIIKLDKLQNRTIFKFDVNSYTNDNIKLKRMRSKTFFNSELKKRETHKKSCNTLNPIIQKHNFEIIDKRRNSIKVFLSSKNVSKPQQIGSLIRLKEFKEFFVKSKERELPSIIERIRKFLNLQKQNFVFDLSSFSIDKLDQTDFFVLYFALSRALQPSFYSLPDNDIEINQIESDILNLVKNPKQFSSFDSDILKKYQNYMKQSQDGQIFTGFWLTKKEDSEVPACRESASTISQDHKVFLFGGFSNVPLNDLWILEAYDNNVLTWIQKPSCPNLNPRYGHCMGFYKNSVIIMFGIGEMMKKIKTRYLFNDVWSFNIEENKWNKIECKGYIPERRAYCAYCVIDNLIFIHGGNQGNRKIFYDDIIGFHLDKLVFCEMYSNHKNGYEGLEKMAFHTAVSVLPSELKSQNEQNDYWTGFHKWKHLESSNIHVF